MSNPFASTYISPLALASLANRRKTVTKAIALEVVADLQAGNPRAWATLKKWRGERWKVNMKWWNLIEAQLLLLNNNSYD